MKDLFRLKTWAGPLTIGSFVVISVTGIMLFFHVNVGLAKLAHEWLGWVLVVGGVAHLFVNWQAFLAYFRKPVGVGIIAIMLLLGGLSMLATGGGGGGPRRGPMMDFSRVLEQSSLTLVAQVAKRDPQAAIDDLKARGIQVKNAEQTVSGIATDNDKRSLEVLACILGNANVPMGGPGGHRGGHH
jgi:hypothetical protein